MTIEEKTAKVVTKAVKDFSKSALTTVKEHVAAIRENEDLDKAAKKLLTTELKALVDDLKELTREILEAIE